jgi:hypothetical protein
MTIIKTTEDEGGVGNKNYMLHGPGPLAGKDVKVN